MNALPQYDLLTAHAYDLPTAVVWSWLKLRADVFVVEQQAIYHDIDAVDTAPTTRQVIAVAADGVTALAGARVYTADGGWWIGRVVADPAMRGTGLAQQVFGHALALCGQQEVRISAQSYLERFYGSFGFVTYGPGYLEDGLPHLPMRRPATR